jgi:hypothetical protein
MANQFRGCYRLAHKLVSLRLVRWRLGTNGKNTKPRGGLLSKLGLCYPNHDLNLTSEEPLTMEWTTPQHEEIDLNCEVSSYANAEL